MSKDEVLQKYIANSGLCSRRKAEELVRLGKVKVNGDLAQLGARVSKEDVILVEGKLVRKLEKKVYIILNKPKGYVCTSRSFEGEKNVFELIKKRPSSLLEEGKLHIVGRLDKDSRGLVLFTNDGEFTEKMTHPRYGHEKEYFVQLQYKDNELRIEEIKNKFFFGIDIGEEDGVVKAKSVEFLGAGKLKIILTTGKKRQIRRMFQALGYEVNDLKRTRIGNIKLGDLKEGESTILK